MQTSSATIYVVSGFKYMIFLWNGFLRYGLVSLRPGRFLSCACSQFDFKLVEILGAESMHERKHPFAKEPIVSHTNVWNRL